MAALSNMDLWGGEAKGKSRWEAAMDMVSYGAAGNGAAPQETQRKGNAMRFGKAAYSAGPKARV